jgi:hypothetical protein
VGGLNQHGARPAGKVAGEARLQSSGHQDLGNRIGLVEPDLDCRQSAGRASC